MRRDDVEQALDALASDAPKPSADAATLIARGRRRLVRQRIVVIGIAAAVVATAAGVGVVANDRDTRRVVSPVPTTAPSGVGAAREIAVASSLEAWMCLNPLQYTDDGGRSWRSVALPESVPLDLVSSCTAVPGGNAWATWPDSKGEHHVLRIRDGKVAEVFSFPRLPERSGLGPLVFVDSNHGWAQTYTYDSGKPVNLYRTLDGGATWKLTTTGVGGGHLDFADPLRGWSSDGTDLFHTADGGVTWQGVDVPEPADRSRLALFQIDAHDNSIVVWRGAEITGSRYRTFFEVSTDGGRSWALRPGPEGFEKPGVDSNAFDAVDGQHWALTSGRALRITGDGGQTWQVRPDVPGVTRIRRIFFPTPGVGWISSDTGTILRTTDAGRTWTDVTNGAALDTPTTNPRPVEVAHAMPAQLAFASETEGWICDSRASYTTDDFDAFGAGRQEVVIPPNPSAVSGDYPQEPLCATAPGGNLWLARASANESLSEIVRVKIRSGGTETSVSPFNTSPFGRIEALDFVDANHGWAIVAHKSVYLRTLYTTQDGGLNWSSLDVEPIRSGLAFENTTHGWSQSNRNPANLAATTDGGRTWHEVDVGVKQAGLGTSVTPVLARGDVIVAYGRTLTGLLVSPFFAVTIEGGHTWSLRFVPTDIGLSGTLPSDFDAADADHWVLGSANHLYVTNDGGLTWIDQQQFAGLASILYVARPSATAMFVSGYGDAAQTSSVVLGTVNGGENWTTVDFSAPPMVGSGAPVNWPGGIVGCPTRTVTPAEPGDPPPGLVDAAFEYIRAQGRFEPDTVSAAYKVGSLGGVFGELFRFHLSSCPRSSVANSWVVELHGVSGSGGGGSTPRAEVVLAHYADGWHVFGRYH